MTQTCHTGGTRVRVGSLTSGSLFFPACFGAKIKPGGWYYLKPIATRPIMDLVAINFVTFL